MSVLAGLDDPIFALATPLAPSALAVIRISGKGSLELLEPLLKGRPNLLRERGHTVRKAVVVDEGPALARGEDALGSRPLALGGASAAARSPGSADGAEELDEVMVAVYRSPHSYTGEDGAEITCHGSLPVIRRILGLLGRSGFRAAGPGEFTRRAFLNGKMDLTRAEAVNEIVRARTDRARALALQRLSGAVERKVSEARDLLLDLQAAVEVQLDYPDEDHGASLDDGHLERAQAILQALAATWERGRIYQEGASAAIAGATNAGKSSLFNLLLRQERAIVSEVHGTTRDWLEGAIDIDGIPVRLFDTAGTRNTGDPLELEGMRRTEVVLRSADLVVYLVDAAVGLSPADHEAIGTHGEDRTLRVWNKIDLPSALSCPKEFLPLSAVTGEGIDHLERAIGERILRGAGSAEGEPLIDSERQRELLARALSSLERFRADREAGVPLDLLAVELREALDSLGEITGEVATAEVLERMFASFCVGK